MTEATSLDTPSSRRAAALVGVVACLVLAGCDRGASKSESAPNAAAANASSTAPEPPIPITMPIQREVGLAWVVPTDIDPAVRKLHVFEDGKELGPMDSLHETIRKKGLGAYSHWKNAPNKMVIFSTSDNSNPNTNGRTYTIK